MNPEAYADIVVFDFDKINMKVDFLQPDHRPEGIEYVVIVDGKIAYKEEAHSGEKAGKVLRRSNFQ